METPATYRRGPAGWGGITLHHGDLGAGWSHLPDPSSSGAGPVAWITMGRTDHRAISHYPPTVALGMPDFRGAGIQRATFRSGHFHRNSLNKLGTSPPIPKVLQRVKHASRATLPFSPHSFLKHRAPGHMQGKAPERQVKCLRWVGIPDLADFAQNTCREAEVRQPDSNEGLHCGSSALPHVSRFRLKSGRT